MIRIFAAAGLGLIISLFGTKLLISWLNRLGVGQPIHTDLAEYHTTKKGTPTMGGIAIVGAAVISYIISAAYRGVYTTRGLLVMGAIGGAGLVGFVDDFIKVRNERNLGLNKRAKMAGLLTVAITFSVLLVVLTEQHTDLSSTGRLGSIGWELGKVGWVLWAVFLIIGFSNATNLTDGLDGLLAGSSIFAFMAFLIIAFWSFRNEFVERRVLGIVVERVKVYDLTPQGLELAVIAAAMVGACAGFLWWNAAPAKIFMGDTGSLAIGTALACLALTTNTVLLLPIIGALFVAETLSVIVQVISFRFFGGRRVFRMAPIHHHFEMGGWPETTVIIRFWMMSAVATAAGVGIYYYDFLRATGTLSR